MLFLKRMLTLVLSLSLIFLSIIPAQAAMVSNHQIIDAAQHSNEKNILLQSIARADVQAQLFDLGVNSDDLVKRVDQLTPQEIAQINKKIADQPAGSGVLGTLLVVFIVFVITDVLGATDIFPFIHPIR